MDINLHSFILVLGLIVIVFIVIDGIKRVRDARSNQFSDDILESDIITSEITADEDDRFKEYEIADDLLNDAFISDLEGSDSGLEGDEEPEQAYAAEIELVQSEGSQVTKTEVPLKEAVGEGFESEVSSSSDELEFEINQELESFSADNDFSEETVMPPLVKKVIEPVQPRKVNVNQPSKAQVETRKRELEQGEQTPQSESPLTELPKTVPVLMEPVELGREVDPNPPHQQELQLPEFVTQALKEEAIVAKEMEPDFESFSIDDVEQFNDSQQYEESKNSVEQLKPAMPVGEKLSERAAAQEIFVINVLNENGPLLKGTELNHIFKVCDMRHGEMDIFHRFEESNGQGKIQFSVVNALKPGTFDLNTIDTMETKGISMFMSLPGPEDAMGAFDAMAEVALVFARNFGASLYDESHSDLTPQTLEHYRNRIREYSRKHFSRK